MSVGWVIAIAAGSSLVTGFFVACTFFGFGYKRRCQEEITEAFTRLEAARMRTKGEA